MASHYRRAACRTKLAILAIFTGLTKKATQSPHEEREADIMLVRFLPKFIAFQGTLSLFDYHMGITGREDPHIGILSYDRLALCQKLAKNYM